ncbi:hypothetical protein [Campylobacter fetus]|nr:hypothetical protein [Campylobacter fetus]
METLDALKALRNAKKISDIDLVAFLKSVKNGLSGVAKSIAKSGMEKK